MPIDPWLQREMNDYDAFRDDQGQRQMERTVRELQLFERARTESARGLTDRLTRVFPRLAFYLIVSTVVCGLTRMSMDCAFFPIDGEPVHCSYGNVNRGTLITLAALAFYREVILPWKPWLEG